MSRKTVDYLPSHGWVVELEEAKVAAKAAPDNAMAHLRVTRAYEMLRQWHKCVISAEIGLALKPDTATRAKVKDYRTTAQAELATESAVDEATELFADVLKGKANLDKVSSPPSFNPQLQYATSRRFGR